MKPFSLDYSIIMQENQASPYFKYAGARADAAVIERAHLQAAEKHAEPLVHPVIMLDNKPYKLTAQSQHLALPALSEAARASMTAQEASARALLERQHDPLAGRYLIPHYEKTGTTQTRKEDRLKARVTRFFYTAQPRIDVVRTAHELDVELEDFARLYGEIKTKNPDYSLSLPYSAMSSEERRLVIRGGQLVGHIVNRIARVGRVILHEGDTKGENTLEPIDALITRWSASPAEDLARRTGMDKPERDHLRRELLMKELDYWLNTIIGPAPSPARYIDAGKNEISIPHDELMRCVRTRNDQRDHDGVLSYLVHEIRKTFTDDLYLEKRQQRALSDPEHHAQVTPEQAQHMHDTIERQTVFGVVTTLGSTCGAIDDAYLAVRGITEHPDFSRFLRSMRQHEDMNQANKFDISDYRSMWGRYCEVARKRCCIDSRDAVNFTPISEEFDFLGTELRWLHDEMRKSMSDHHRDPRMLQALDLLDKALNLVDLMAETRIPLNQHAPEVYDKKLPYFEKRDASSFGRLKEKIDQWAHAGKHHSRGA